MYYGNHSSTYKERYSWGVDLAIGDHGYVRVSLGQADNVTVSLCLSFSPVFLSLPLTFPSISSYISMYTYNLSWLIS